MKLSAIALAAGLAWSLSSIAIAQPPAGGTTITGQDRALDARIEKRLSDDASLKKYHVKVAVEGGVATLSGTVATEAERTRAGELARVPGVTRVDNKIVADLDAATRAKGTTGKIEEKAKSGAEKTKDAGEKAYDKSKDAGEKAYDKSKSAGEKAVDKSKDGVSKTGEAITDGWISSRIKTKYMGDEALRASDIKVDTTDHVVTLTGTVVSPAAHAKAIEFAKDVEGVQRVVDHMKIVPKQE
jgi:hyperosmotically inducible periplasmic protein